MFRNVLSVLLAAALAVPVAAQPMTPGHDAARAIGESIFLSLDIDRSGAVTQEEMIMLGDLVFETMDRDASLLISRDEMISWEHGLADMAAFRGRSQAHEAAMGMVFDIFDADGDAGLTAEEHRAAIDRAHQLADSDGDGKLSAREFRESFIISVALRNAMGGVAKTGL
ncbi:MAG: hypothetical protein AAF919_01915 [Pseudomonadota bacterium]